MYRNVLWIDPAIRDYQVFVDSVNEETLALVYPAPLVFGIERIGFVFEKHGPMALYLQQNADLLIGSGVKHMDFLACDTLPEWKPYYDTLTGIRVGASNNRTGNLQYGGDWLMESTCENVESIYFTQSIEYYKYLLGLSLYSMALDSYRNVWACGMNEKGQLGLGPTTNLIKSYTKVNISNIAKMNYTYQHSILLDVFANLWTCGDNQYGQLGLGNRINTSTFTKVTSISNIASIACGCDATADRVAMTLALDFSGNLWGCGANNKGQLGLGNTNISVPNFSKVPKFADTTIVSIACGTTHSVALDASGNLWTCGENDYGQLGLGNRINTATFTKVTTISNIASIAGGYLSTMAIDFSGNVWACGYSKSDVGRSIGLDETSAYIYGSQYSFQNFTRIIQLSNIISIATGENHYIALDKNGKIWTCGLNGNKQLGMAGGNLKFFTQVVSTPAKIVAINGGSAHTTALDIYGNIWACGSKIYIGIGTNEDVDYFINISTISKVISIGTNTMEVLPILSVTTFSPTSAVERTTLSLNGTNFSQIDSVRFGTVNASFLWNSSINLSVVVPRLTPLNCSITVYDIQNNATYPDLFTNTTFRLTTFTPTSAPLKNTIILKGTNFSNITSVQFGSVNVSFFLDSSTNLLAVVPNSSNVSIRVDDLYGNNSIYPTSFTFLNTYASCYFGYMKATAGLNQINVSADFLVQLRLGATTLYDLRNQGPTLITQNASSVTTTIPVTLADQYYPILLTCVNTSTRNIPSINVSVNGSVMPLSVTLDKNTSGLYVYNLSTGQLNTLFSDIPLLNWENYTDTVLSRIYSPTWAYGNASTQTFWRDSSFSLLEGELPVTILNISMIELARPNLSIFGAGFYPNLSVYLDDVLVTSTYTSVYRVNASNFSQITLRDGPVISNRYSLANVTSMETTAIINTNINLYGSNFSGTVSSIQIGGANVSFTINASSVRVKVPGIVQSNMSVRLLDPAGGVLFLSSLTTLPTFTLTSFTPTRMATQGIVTLNGANFSNISAVLFGSTNASFVWNSPTNVSVRVPPQTATNCSIQVYDIYDNTALYPTRFTYVDSFATCFFGFFKPVVDGSHQFNISTDFLGQLRLGNNTLFDLRNKGPTLVELNASTLTVNSAALTLRNASYYPFLLTYVTPYEVNTNPNVLIRANVSYNGSSTSLVPFCTFDKNISGLYKYTLDASLLRQTLPTVVWPPISFDTYYTTVLALTSRIYSPEWAYGPVEEQTYWLDAYNISLVEGPVPATRLNVSSVIPSQQTLLVTGTGFHSNVSAYVNGVLSTQTTSNGIMTINTAAYASVLLTDGLAKSNLFTGYSVASIDRTTAIRNSSVNFYGFNFNTSNISYIQIGNTSTRAFTILSNTSLQMKTPESTQLQQPLTFFSTNGNSLLVTNFTIPAPMTITSYNPNFLSQNAPFEIVGTNFSQLSYVKIGTTNVSVTFTPTSANVTIPNLSGSVPVVIYDAYQNNVSLATNITIYKNLNLSTITSVVPGAPVQITGLDFYNLSQVNFGGTVVPISSYTVSQINCIAPVTARNISVGVYNLYGYNASISYTAVSTAAATSYGPVRASKNAPLTFTGLYFANLSYVSFDTNNSSTRVLVTTHTNSSFLIKVPPLNTSMFNLTLYDKYGNNTSYLEPFEYTTLTTTDFSPAIATSGATLTLNGTNLSNLSAVTFEGTSTVSVTTLTRISDQQITVIVPVSSGGAPRLGPSSTIRISDKYGNDSLYATSFLYRYVTLSEFTPSKAVPNNILTLRGNDFYDIDYVKFSNGTMVYAKDMELQTTQLRFIVPNDLGTFGVMIYDIYHNYTSINSTFTFLPKLNASSMPAQSVQRSTVMIKGLYFADLSDVYFGTEPANFSYTSTQIQATVPDSTQTNVSVIIRDQYTNTTALSFTYIYPQIQTFPTSGPQRKQLQVLGQNLSDISYALFGDFEKVYSTNVSQQGFKVNVPDGYGNVSVRFYDKYLNPLDPLPFQYLNPSLTGNTSSGTTNWIVELRGENLLDTRDVILGEPITQFDKTLTTIRFPVPPNSGNFSIEVIDLHGNHTFAPYSFQYLNPKVTGINGLVGRMSQRKVLVGENLDYTAVVLYGNVSQLGELEAYNGSVVTVVPEVRGNMSIYAIDICGNQTPGPFTFESLGGNMSLFAMIPQEGTTNTPVTLGGENIDFTDRVTFGQNASILLNTSTQIKCLAPPGEGKVNVFVYDILNLSVFYYSTFTYKNPSVTSILPIHGPNQMPVTITGINLSNTSVVYWGNTPIPFTPGDRTLTFKVPAGTADTSIRVTDIHKNEIQYPTVFRYENSSLQQITPTASPQNASLRLSGLYLENTSYVMFGSTKLSGSRDLIIPPGEGNVSVRTYDLFGNEARYDSFTYLNPAITTLSQSYGTANMELFFEGVNLEWIKSVSMNGATVNSRIYTNSIFFTIPPGSEIASIELVNPYVEGLIRSFEYRNPVFQDITPMGRQGTPCVIQGNHLQDMNVYFNDQPYAFQSRNASRLTIGFPSRGTYQVRLESPFTVLNASSIVSLGGPVSVTRIVPSTGPNRSASVILGANLGYTTQVWFGDASATINYKADGYVNVSVPSGTGVVPVTIYDIQNASFYAGNYTYRNPNVSNMTPRESRINTKVTITGIHLDRTEMIVFQGRNLSVIKNNTSVTFVVPDSSGNASVVLVDDVGNRNYPGEFNYITPTITYTGNFAGITGDIIYIEGTYLYYTQRVKFGARNASFIYDQSLNRLRIIVPNGQKQRSITLIDDGENIMTYPTKFLYTQFSSILLSPFYGKPNTLLNIQLLQFGDVSHVEMGGSILPYVPLEDVIQIRVPDLSGVVQVNVMDTEGEIMSKPFRYESIVLSEVTPITGLAGTTLFVRGSRFSTVSRIEFGNVLAPDYTLITDSLIKVTVPPNIQEYSTIFFYDSMENLGTYIEPFQCIFSLVTSFTRSGRIGDTFTVTGQQLAYVKAITFDEVSARDLVATDTQVTCTIPYGVTSPNIRMIDRTGTSIEIALNITALEDRFTYIFSTPQPQQYVNVQCLATDKQGRLFVSSGTTVTSNGYIYTNVLPILGMAVEDSILYLCDGTNYIVRYNITTRKSLPRYVATSSVKVIKRYNNSLYALCSGPVLTVIHDLTRVDYPLENLDYQGMAVDTFLYLTYLDPYDIDDPPAVLYGGVSKLTLTGEMLDPTFLTGIPSPKDLLVVGSYLYVDAPRVYQYDLNNLGVPISYQTQNSFYTSLAYGQGTLYLANQGQSVIENIPAPLEPFTEVVCYTITPKGASQCLIEITGIHLDRIYSIEFNKSQVSRLVTVSTNYLSFIAPEGTGTPVIYLLDQNNVRIPHSLTFTYENTQLYQCSPREGVEQSVYLFGEHLDRVRYVYLGNERLDFEVVRPTTLHLITPQGTGVLAFTLVDQEGNVISPGVTFSYNRIISSICFQRGTLVYTDQGALEIQTLIPHLHTIYGEPIRAITSTYYNETHLIRIEPHALGLNCPVETTHISKLHKIFFQGRMIPAYRLIRKGVSWVPYDGEKLYNVLLYREGRMNVQGMICETLDPRNSLAGMFTNISP